MKYIFVINPAAGKQGSEEDLLKVLSNVRGVSFEIYSTREAGDGTRFVRSYCKDHASEMNCFIAVGGDGTLNEVINGIINRENAVFGCWPSGSGNDYVKYFGGAQYFLDIEKQLNGRIKMVDVMKMDSHYSVNVINFGFESAVAETMNKVRRKAVIGGKNAYTTGIVKSLFTSRHNKGEIKVDGRVINPDGTYMLCTCANGSYVGGAYNCAPSSIVDDGLLEVCEVKPVSIAKLASLIKVYRNGEHLNDPRFSEILTYARGKTVEITSEKEMSICYDGEITYGTHFVIQCLPKKIGFLVPEGAKLD